MKFLYVLTKLEEYVNVLAQHMSPNYLMWLLLTLLKDTVATSGLRLRHRNSSRLRILAPPWAKTLPYYYTHIHFEVGWCRDEIKLKRILWEVRATPINHPSSVSVERKPSFNGSEKYILCACRESDITLSYPMLIHNTLTMSACMGHTGGRYK